MRWVYARAPRRPAAALKPVAPAAPVRPPKYYDTAEKVMDLDGSKVYVKTIGDKTRADGVQRGRTASSTPPAAGR